MTAPPDLLDQPDPLALARAGCLAALAGRDGEALTAFAQALALAPDCVPALIGMADQLGARGDWAAAEPFAEHAVSLAPDDAEARSALGRVWLKLRRLEEAGPQLAMALTLAPDHHAAALDLHETALSLCAWAAADLAEAPLRRAIAAQAALPPFALLRLGVDPATLIAASRRWALARPGPIQAPADPQPPRQPGAPRRLGILSSDLRDHPVGQGIGDVLACLDRSAWRVIACASGPTPTLGDPIRARIRAAVDEWLDLPDDDAAAAALLQAQRLDVLIDLNGWTAGARPGVLARRPAPVQLSWSGYPGPSGAPWIDGLIADAVAAPPDHPEEYAEPVLRLPGCYMPQDRARPQSPIPPRADLGLPENAVVLADFVQPWKLRPAVWDAYAAVLRAAPAAVLWRLDPGAGAAARLAAGLAERGVDPGRMILAPRLPHAQHLARLGAADLALDAWPYGAHTTGAEALWRGVPLLTLTGGGFARRVGESLVRAAGWDAADQELLIARDEAGFVARGAALAGDPAGLAALRGRLVAARESCSLFDAPGMAAALAALLAAF